MVAAELSRNTLLATMILVSLIQENPFYTIFWSNEFSAFITYLEKHSSLFPIFLSFYPVLRFCHQCSNVQILAWEKRIDPSLFLQLGDWAERNAAVWSFTQKLFKSAFSLFIFIYCLKLNFNACRTIKLGRVSQLKSVAQSSAFTANCVHSKMTVHVQWHHYANVELIYLNLK